MADDVKNTAPFTVVATSSSRVRELPIKDGQLIFVQDKSRIAFDFKGKRKFYNQITELETEQERTALSEPDDLQSRRHGNLTDFKTKTQNERKPDNSVTG